MNPAARIFLLMGLFATALAGSHAAVAKVDSDARPPNVILILADDLGYGDLGCFGQQTLKTPRLDQMAAQGMRLTHFYAGSTVCAPSRAVLLTGIHTGRNVVRGNDRSLLSDDALTLADVMKRSGYATACIGKWGVGHPPPLDDPARKGFDHFFGYINMWHAHNFYPEFLIRNGKRFPLRNIASPKWASAQDLSNDKAGRGVAVKRLDYAPNLFTDDALAFIDANQNRPFFLYLALNTPHANNEAGRQGMEVPDLGEFADKDWPEPEKGFARMIQMIDRDVGRILDRLRDLGIAEQTLVIFTSDNGPHHEGGHKVDFFDSNGPLRGAKRDLYEGGIRVPTIAWRPNVIKAGSTSDHPAYFGDFLATFAAITGQPMSQLSENPDIQSISFLPTLLGRPTDQETHDHLYWEFLEQGTRQAVRFGNWKAVRQPMWTGRMELYDLSTDLGESKDVAREHPAEMAKAEALMKAAHRPRARGK